MNQQDRLDEIVLHTILPALRWLPAFFTSPEAVCMLAAIGGTESAFKERRQIGGPAHGFFQFEEIGVKEVLTNPATESFADMLLRRMRYINDAQFIHYKLTMDDNLAVCIARLMLWTVPDKLPSVIDRDEAYRQYLEAWKPGKPSKERFTKWHAMACRSIQYAGGSGGFNDA